MAWRRLAGLTQEKLSRSTDLSSSTRRPSSPSSRRSATGLVRTNVSTEKMRALLADLHINLKRNKSLAEIQLTTILSNLEKSLKKINLDTKPAIGTYVIKGLKNEMFLRAFWAFTDRPRPN